MKNFGMALKRALDANGRLPSELAKAAGVTGNAVARWLKCISFQRKKNPLAKSAICEGIFYLLPSGYRVVRYSAISQSSASMSAWDACQPGCHCPRAVHIAK